MNFYRTYSKGLNAVFLWTMALLVFLFSCPVKKSFLENFLQSSAIPAKAPAQPTTQSTASYIQEVSCVADDTAYDLSVQQAQQIMQQPVLPISRMQASGIHWAHQCFTGDRQISFLAQAPDLPLFIQHAALVI